MNLLPFIDKLENFPTSISFHERIKKRFQITDKGWKDNLRQWNTKEYQKARYIIEDSIGKSFEDVFSRCRPHLKKIVRFGTPYELFTDIVEIPYEFKDNEPYNTRHYITGLYIDQDDHIAFKDHTRFFKSKTGITPKVRIAAYRRSIKIQKKSNEFLLKLLDKPDLYKYYTKLKNELSSLIYSYSRNYRPDKPEIQLGYWADDYSTVVGNKKRRMRWRYKYYKKKWIPYPDPQQRYVKAIAEWKDTCSRISRERLKTNARIINLKKEIELIESEDYSTFYNSRTYLFSIGKECHHFEGIKN